MASRVPVVVLSHGVGDCRDMLRISVSRTLEWCQKQDMDFRASTRREAEPDGHVFWDKLALIRRVLYPYPDGTLGIWMDADCMVVQTDVCPRNVLPDNIDLGMRRVLVKETNTPWWNSGVIFMRNTSAFRLVFDAFYALRHHPDSNDMDEWAINKVLNETGYPCFELPVAWNAMNKDDYPIIRGYHTWPHQRVKEKLADEKLVSTRRLRISRD